MSKLKKVLTYATVVTTIVWSVGLLALPFGAGAAVAGDLVKKASSPAVYYVGSDSKLHVFTSLDVYKSWYADFSGVKTISDTEFNSYGFGTNVFPRPGVKLVQAVDGETPWNIVDPKVYAVSKGGVLRHITSASVAAEIFGVNWESLITPVVISVFTQYTVGSDVAASGDYDKDAEMTDSATINDDLGLGDLGTVPSGSSLTVALAPDTPAAGLAIYNANRVPFTKVNVTASADGDIVIDQVVVERKGIAADANFSSLALINGNTNVQIGLNQNIKSSHKANFNNDITVPAGTTISLILAGNMGTSGAGNIAILTLDSILLKGGAVVIGSLPISGNGMTLNGVTLGQVTVTRGSYSNATNTAVKVGQTDYTLASLKLAANSTEDQAVEQLKFYQSGTASLSTDVENWKLLKDNTTVIPATITIDGKYITIEFTANAVAIGKGKNVQLVLKGDVISGSTRTIKLVIYRTTDVLVRGQVYGQARTPTYTGTGSSTLAGEVMSDNQFTISQGTLRIDANTAVVGAQNVAYGDGQVLGSWNFVVQGEPVEITALTLNVSSTTADSDTFDNVKLVTADGTLLMGPSSSMTNGALAFAETIEIPVGTNLVKAVSDIETTGGFAANETFFFSINGSNITASGADTTESITATPAAAVAASTQTFKSSKLEITRNALPVNSNVVLGQQDFKYGSWTFDTTGSGENIRITQIQIGNLATTTNVDNLTLYDMSYTSETSCKSAYPSATYDTYGCAIRIKDSGSATTAFDLTDPIVQVKETQKVMELRADVRTTAASYVQHQDQFVMFVTGTATDVVTAVGTETNDAVTPTGSGIDAMTDGATITIVAAGTLTVNTGSSVSSTLVASETTNELGRLKLTATNENIDVEELALCLEDGATANGSEAGDSDDLTQLKVYKSTDMTNPIITGNIGSGNSCRLFTLTKGTLQVPKDSTAGVELVIKGVTADIGTGQPGTSGADFQVGIGGTDGIKGTGTASSATATETYTASTSSTFKLHLGYPQVALNDLAVTTGAKNGSVLADFTITNPGANPIAIYRMTFVVTTSGDTDIGVNTATIRSVSLGQDISPSITGTIVEGLSRQTFTSALMDPDDVSRTSRPYRIAAGGSARFQLKAGTVVGTDGTAGGNISTSLVGDTATTTSEAKMGVDNIADAYAAFNQGSFVWSDLWTNDAWDANGGNATTAAQWWNGFLVPGLSQASSTFQTITE